MTITTNTEKITSDIKIECENSFIYVPDGEWNYSHHAAITFFKDKFYAMWSNGRSDEDSPGQRVIYAVSANGLNWSSPRLLCASTRGDFSETVLTAAGFHVDADNLVAYVGSYEYVEGRRTVDDINHINTRLLAITSGDGETWGAPIDTGLKIIPNFGPVKTRSGRLIISGNISFPFSDSPGGMTNWRNSYLPGCDSVGYDDSESFHRAAVNNNWEVDLCEGSFFQTDDGVLHMLLRSNTNYLWQSDSYDDGQTWSEPRQTRFTDSKSKFHCGRLPDGRFFCIGNPDFASAIPRSPLVISLSSDGSDFNQRVVLGCQNYKLKYEGMHKGGDFGYPHSIIHNNALWIIVSRYKEAIQILKVPLPELAL
jgi:hypothetical protein